MLVLVVELIEQMGCDFVRDAMHIVPVVTMIRLHAREKRTADSGGRKDTT